MRPHRFTRVEAGVLIELVRGPYQNNGATPWYAEIMLGTPGQKMKISLDTGGHFIWTTSTLCSEGDCLHYGGGRFDPSVSSTFAWEDHVERTVDFGPWGSMIVKTGTDDIWLTSRCALHSSLYLAKSYRGNQFEQLDWDGGIGLPASSNSGEPRVLAELMTLGYIDPEFPYMSFTGDAAAKTGSCRLGAIDSDAFDPESGIFLRWEPYPGLGYLWSTMLHEYRVGGFVSSNVYFCLDSGSSEFKGDAGIMQKTLLQVGDSGGPDLRLNVGSTNFGDDVGMIVVPPSVYQVDIEAGRDRGKQRPQFNPLGAPLPDLIAVGSVLMDHLYTVFEYKVTEAAAAYELTPAGIWIFNRMGGPGLIKSRTRAPLWRRPVHRKG